MDDLSWVSIFLSCPSLAGDEDVKIMIPIMMVNSDYGIFIPIDLCCESFIRRFWCISLLSSKASLEYDFQNNVLDIRLTLNLL